MPESKKKVCDVFHIYSNSSKYTNLDSRVDLSIKGVYEAPAAQFWHKSKMVQNKMFDRIIRLPDEHKICIIALQRERQLIKVNRCHLWSKSMRQVEFQVSRGEWFQKPTLL
jgi:shikimate kinase